MDSERYKGEVQAVDAGEHEVRGGAADRPDALLEDHLPVRRGAAVQAERRGLGDADRPQATMESRRTLFVQAMFSEKILGPEKQPSYNVLSTKSIRTHNLKVHLQALKAASRYFARSWTNIVSGTRGLGWSRAGYLQNQQIFTR